MKTYAKKKRKKELDWNKELKAPNISNKRWSELSEYSGEWVTCACGNQCAIIPRNDEGEPFDMILAKLGVQFYKDVNHQNAKEAIKTLVKIEKRSALLINQMRKDLENC